MTFEQVYRQAKSILFQAGNESPAFDASCLFEKAFGMNRQQRAVHGQEAAPEDAADRCAAMAKERASGRPLQYILGEWPFLDFQLDVGEGVLIPREETELLVHTAAGLLKDTQNPLVLDLCAGTGAVALGVASLVPGARVFAAEWCDPAFSYLRKNIERVGKPNVRAVRLDVLNAASPAMLPDFDCIVSNPPYVETGELAGLQPEVRREPREALDGGADGLRFYRAIARLWLPKLRPGGAAAVEIGEGQAPAVRALFGGRLNSLQTRLDFNGIERVVCGIRQ